MSAEGNAAPGAASAAADQANPPKPLLAPTGHASLDVLVGDLNNVAAPFQNLSDPDATALDKANDIVGGILGAVQAPLTLLNDGFALATAGIAKLFPPMPAATLGMFHLGIPHLHDHPPALPIPLPSFGPVALAGCVSVLVNGIPAARAGDLGISVTCGTLAPPFEVFTGSSKVFIGGARAARMLDITKHCQPGAAAGKAMSTLEKVVSVGGVALGVAGIGAEALNAVDKAVDAEEGKKKKVEAKKSHVEPAEVRYEDIAVDYDDPESAAQAFAEAQAAAVEAAAEAQRAQDAKAADEAALEQLMIADKSEADSATAKFTGIQAGLDAAAMALGFLMGMDPGMPPCFGAVLTGMPNVLIGGFPMPPWTAVARGLGKLGRLRNHPPPRARQNNACETEGHPVDPVTGANFDSFVDYEHPGPPAFRWTRHYTSADAGREGPMGRGFRHGYEHSLEVDLDRAVYTSPEGRTVEIPLPGPGRRESVREGHVLRIEEAGSTVTYFIASLGKPTLELVRERTGPAPARLARLFTEDARIDVQRDVLGRMTGTLETSKAGVVETRFLLDDQGHLVEVRRGPSGERDLPLVAAYGFDRAGCLVVWQDALGAKGRYTYDAAHRIVCTTDRDGYSFHFVYDDRDRCVEARGDDGLWGVSLRYEPENRRTIATRANGGVWIHEHDENGTIVCVTDPHGGERRRIVDEEGKVVREVTPDGQTNLRFLYDPIGAHYGVLDRFGYEHPPLDEEPNPPDPRAHLVPTTALAQQWGSILEEIPSASIWPTTLPSAAQALLRSSRREPHAPWQARDALGRLIEEIDASGHRQAWSYDPNGNEVRYVDRDGREHRSAVTSWNLVGAEADPLGNQTYYDYTPHEEIARVTDPGGAESRYEHDLEDRLTRVIRHGVVREEYAYDLGGHLIEKRDGAGNLLLRRSIAANGLPSERRLSSGEVYRYDYDEQGRITRASRDDVEVERSFDALGRLLTDEQNGRGVQHRFDRSGLVATTYLGRFTVRWSRDPDGSLRIEAPVGGVNRIRGGEPESLLTTLGNGTSVLSTYDEEERCTGRAVWRPRGARIALWSVRYTYSPEGELRRAADDARGTTDYQYDAAHRLVGASGPDGATTTIVFDGAGNVREKPGLSPTELREGNRLLAAGRERFHYDTRNHLAEHVNEAGESTRYRYDSAGMLVEIAWSHRDEVWTAAYDGLGRRLFKALGQARTEYCWDGDRLAAEISPSGALRIYVYPGPEALVPLLFLDYRSVDADPESGRAYYPIGNQIGVPLHIESAEGEVVWRAEQVEPHGKVTVAPGATIAFSPRFPGHFFDEETGLHYNRHRYFSPRLGRYLQSDPIGQAGGINLYAYPANPLVDVDVLGLTHLNKRKRSDDGSSDTEEPPAKRVSPRIEAVRKEQFSKLPQAPQTIPGVTWMSGMEHNVGTATFSSIHTQIKASVLAALAQNQELQSTDAKLKKSASDEWAATKKSKSRGVNDIQHTIDPVTQRTVFAVGRIIPTSNDGNKKSPPNPFGGIDTTHDDRGHLVPESGVADGARDRVNSTPNIIPENWVINQHYKKPFEDAVKQHAENNPDQIVMTLHQPVYDGTELRPKYVYHFVSIDGKIVHGLQLNNPAVIKDR